MVRFTILETHPYICTRADAPTAQSYGATGEKAIAFTVPYSFANVGN
jgi:hypothetical protein